MRQIDTSVKRRYRIIWKRNRDSAELRSFLYGVSMFISGYDFWEFEDCFVETRMNGFG